MGVSGTIIAIAIPYIRLLTTSSWKAFKALQPWFAGMQHLFEAALFELDIMLQASTPRKLS